VSELETRLAELPVEWPPAPDVAARVRARVEAEPAARTRRPLARRLRPAFAIPLALLAVAVGGVAAVPSARSAVLRWLGIEGVRIERVPEAPTPAPSPALDLGERAPLAAGTLVPRALGRPDAVYAAGDLVTLLYRPRPGLPESEQSGAGALVSQFPGRTNVQFIRKFAGPDTTIEPVQVDGERGYWVAGEPHGLLYEDPTGDVREAPTRLAGPTLVWRRGRLTLRLEADVSKAQALAIARSVG
jgi:hypothetical protein